MNKTLIHFFDQYLPWIEPGMRIPLLAACGVLVLILIALAILRIANKESATKKDDSPSLSKETTQAVELDTPTKPTRRGREVISEVRDTSETKWLSKLKDGLSKTRTQLSGSLSAIFSGKEFSASLLEEVHEVLYRADVGTSTADFLVDSLRKEFKGQTTPPEWGQVKSKLKSSMETIFSNVTLSQNDVKSGPKVILVVGVNGVGKTTSIGKLAAHLIAKDEQVLLCAADTYRAAAIEQLKEWGSRIEADVISHKAGADPAAVAYDGVKAAISRNVDTLLIDTAGRLHSKKELMEELGKIKKVIGKDLPGAPHEVWIVIDATTGQNAIQQVRAFKEVVDITGLVVTKLDGTAKGGVIIGATKEFQLPIKYIGVGEQASDLREFNASQYVDVILN